MPRNNMPPTRTTEHTIATLGPVEDIKTAAAKSIESKDFGKKPDIEHLNGEVTARILRDIDEHPPENQQLKEYYAGIVDTFGKSVMAYQIRATANGNPDYNAYRNLDEHDRAVQLERWRQTIMEGMLYPVTAYTETLGEKNDPFAEKRRLVMMMYMQARVNGGAVSLDEIRNVDRHGSGQRELDVMTEAELTEAVRIVNGVAQYQIPTFSEFTTNPTTYGLSASELERKRADLERFVALIERYSPPELENDPNWNYLFPEKAHASRYMNHNKNVERARKDGLVTGPLDARPRDDIVEVGIFGNETHPKPASYIETKTGYIVDPETHKTVAVTTLEWTLKAPVRRIELDIGYKPDMLLQATTDRKKLEVVSRAIASGSCDSPQTLAAMQERFESAQLSNDEQSVRFAVSPPPNWLYMPIGEFRDLYKKFERTKASFEKAHVNVADYRGKETPEMAMLAENKLDKNELSVESAQIANVFNAEITASHEAGNNELEAQLKEAKESTLRRINEVINVVGIESEYVAIAEERLLRRGVLSDEYKALHPDRYKKVVEEEAEQVKLEMLYKVLAVKKAANKVRALQKDNPEDLLDYTLNMDYTMEQWTAEKMSRETQRGDSLDEELQRIGTVFEAIRRTPGGVEMEQMRLEARRAELRAKFILAAQAWSKLSNDAGNFMNAEIVKLKADLIGDVTPNLFKDDIDSVIDGKYLEYQQVLTQVVSAIDNLNARLEELASRNVTTLTAEQQQNVDEVKELITIMRDEQDPTPAEVSRLNRQAVNQNIRTNERDIRDFETELVKSSKYGTPDTGAENVLEDLRGFADRYAPPTPRP